MFFVLFFCFFYMPPHACISVCVCVIACGARDCVGHMLVIRSHVFDFDSI